MSAVIKKDHITALEGICVEFTMDRLQQGDLDKHRNKECDPSKIDNKLS